MPKKLNEWLDEFVENGADPSDVTAWPEGVGGSSEAGVNMIITGGWYRLGVDELARVIATMEQDMEEVQRVRYGYYVYGRGGSGVEFVYGEDILLDDTPGTLEIDIPGTVLKFSHVASTMSESLIENKEEIKLTPLELASGYYFGFIEGPANTFYPIDITKVFIPTEAPTEAPDMQ